MSVEFVEGFDWCTNVTMPQRKWDLVAASTDNIVSGRFTGSNAAQLTFGGNGSLGVTLPSNQATRLFGFAYKYNGSFSVQTLLQVLDLGTVQVDLTTDSSGHIMVRRGSGTATLATSTNTLSVATWYYIEFLVTISSSAGVYELRVNGSSTGWAPNTTGANTQMSSNAYSNQLKILANNGGGCQFDDMYVKNDSTFLGDSRVVTVLPTGDGATVNWTPSTGTAHYANVDDPNPNDDTDYNSSATSGQVDLYSYPASGVTGSIVAVQANMMARKDDIGTRQIQEQCRSAGTTYTGSVTQTLTSNYLMYRQIRETDPATSAAWTVTNLNAAQFGVKVV